MSELKQCGACSGCANQCRHEAENPPALGGEPIKRYDMSVFGYGMIELDSGAYVHIDDHRAHVARLQAEVERQRKNFGDMTSLCNEAVQKHDALLARTAELEGLLRKASGFIKISAERLPKKHRTIRSHAFEFVSSIDAALNNKEVPCCTPTDAERAILAAGDHTPQELWGGPRPTCPKCVKTEGQQS